MRQIHLTAWLAGLVLAAAALPAGAIVNGEPREEDKRFDAVCAVSLSKWIEPAPLPRDPKKPKPKQRHNWFGAGTLVAPNLIVTAAHLLPKGRIPKPGEMAVRFRRRPDGSVGSVKKGDKSFYHVRVVGWRKVGADVAIGQLAKEVEHIQPIAIDYDQAPFTKRTGFVAGWGSESKWMGDKQPRRRLLTGATPLSRREGRKAVGIDAFRTESRARRKNEKTGKVIRGAYIISEQTVPNMHDSGGAMLIEDAEGKLKLVGVISSYTGGTWLGQFQGNDKVSLPGSDKAPAETADP